MKSTSGPRDDHEVIPSSGVSAETARLVMGLARLRKAGQLPPLGDGPSAEGR